jgi:putative SOS response-associated peptidase YedK
MCNLYSMTTNQDAIKRLFKVVNSYVGNLPAMPSIFPDYEVPVVRSGAGSARELMLMRWGMPNPPLAHVHDQDFVIGDGPKSDDAKPH